MEAKDLDIEGCMNLADAIVAQASKDYLTIRKKLDGLKDGKEKEKLEKKLKKIKQFFRSKWYKTLTPVNGDRLVEILDARFDEMKRTGKL